MPRKKIWRRRDDLSLEGLGYLQAALLGHAHSRIYCEKDGIVPVPDDQLPVRLPEQLAIARRDNRLSRAFRNS